jgi:hypothetical protein
VQLQELWFWLLPIYAKSRLTLCFLFLLLTAGCQPVDTSLAATQTSLRVELSPTLEYLSPAIQACTLQNGNLHIILEEKPASEMNKTGADVSLLWGDLHVPAVMKTYRLGSDRLVLAVHKNNPIEKLKVDQAFFLVRGGLATWGDAIKQFCPECSTSDTYLSSTIEPWQYTPGTDVFGEVANLSLESRAASLGRVWLIPGPKSLAEAITNNPSAIGWLPARWLNENLKEIAIEGIDPSLQVIPVLAVTPQQPQPVLQEWLHCLQSSYNN